MTSPAQNHHFFSNEDAELLDENKKEKFPSVTAKLLHIVKRGRPDLETLVSFLTTRVTKSNVDDWKNLKRGLKYVKNSIKDKIMIGAKILYYLYTWIDAAYAVHNNMRGNTEGSILMGYGIVYRKYLTQKINVRAPQNPSWK